jgi:hypothetical protein
MTHKIKKSGPKEMKAEEEGKALDSQRRRAVGNGGAEVHTSVQISRILERCSVKNNGKRKAKV